MSGERQQGQRAAQHNPQLELALRYRQCEHDLGPQGRKSLPRSPRDNGAANFAFRAAALQVYTRVCVHPQQCQVASA
jgi:hypothetical protein